MVNADYIIVTDNMADLPEEYIKEHNLPVMHLSYLMNGVCYDGENRQDTGEFYAQMRGGALPVTSQITPDQAEEFLKNLLKDCPNIICIAFSSGLSGTCGSISTAAARLNQKIPGANITVIDSLCASLGQGLLVHKALQLQKNGAGYDETVKWVEENKLHVVHNFTVDDLFHLHRGGRVSKATAIIGTMISIKPMLHVDNEGHLIAVGKAHGRKKSILALEEAMEAQIGSWRDKNDIVFITHGDCLKDAELLKETIRKKMGIDAYLINYVGPVIGSHSGPGTLALFYMGDVR